MNNENIESNQNSEILESDEQLVDNAKLMQIVQRILELEKEANNKNFNEDDTKKKIMKIIEEELKCY